jgi:CRP-like cAMP-binding protein
MADDPPGGESACSALQLDSMLKRSVWAKWISSDEFEFLRASAFEVRVHRGADVARAGEPATHWTGVIDGFLKMSTTLADGKTSSLSGVTAGGWVGEGSLMKAEPRRYDLVALRDSRIACIPRATFLGLLNRSLAFSHFMIAHLNARLSTFISITESDRLMGPDGRVARSLTTLFDPILYPNAGKFVPVSQEEVGLLAGVSRQRVNAALRRLQTAGLIRIEYGGITILDLQSLVVYAGTATSGHERIKSRREKTW